MEMHFSGFLLYFWFLGKNKTNFYRFVLKFTKFIFIVFLLEW